MGTRTAVLILLSVVIPLACAAGGGWSYTQTRTTCKNELAVNAECYCNNVAVAENLKKLIKKHLHPQYYTGTPIEVNSTILLMDGQTTLTYAHDIQSMWDALADITIEGPLTIHVPCSQKLWIDGTLYLDGFTSHRISIVGGTSPTDPVCDVTFRMENADAIDVASADVNDMRAAIVVSNGANIALDNFRFIEDGTNDLLTIGLWIEDGSRVYGGDYRRSWARKWGTNYYRKTAFAAPATPSGPSPPQLGDPKYSLTFEKFFAGVFVSNFGMFRAPRRENKYGGVKCDMVQTCVAAERLALAEVDNALMLGAHNGQIKAAGILARGNSLVLADGAKISGFWTGAMAREGSGVRLQGATLDGLDSRVGYRMDYAVRTGEASYVIAHGANATDIFGQTVVVNTNAVFVATDFRSETYVDDFERDTLNCVAVDTNGAAVVKGLTCIGASRAGINATNGGAIIADNMDTVTRSGKDYNSNVACVYAQAGVISGGGNCNSSDWKPHQGVHITTGSVVLLDNFDVVSSDACFSVEHDSHLGSKNPNAVVSCETRYSSRTAGSSAFAVSANHQSSVNVPHLSFLPPVSERSMSINATYPCFNNYQASSQHYGSVKLESSQPTATCDHKSLWVTDAYTSSVGYGYELCL